MIATFIPPEKLGTPPMSESPWALLPTASNHAAALDTLYVFITILCVISMVLIIGAQLYFMVKYRKRSDADRTSPVTHNTKLEIGWSVIPSLFLIVIFVWGEVQFMDMSSPPANAIDVRITGQKWQWTVEYPQFPGGPSLSCPGDAAECEPTEKTPTLYVPLNEPVRLTMNSVDVIHSFYIPAFRVKKDVVPGRYSNLWFTAIEEGEFPVFCTEYCGDEHSSMLAKVIVLPKDEWAATVKKATELKLEEGETMAHYGERLYGINGCAACHTLDGSAKVGPSFQGLYGRTEQLTDGSSLAADDNYIRESILEPNAKVVAGYAPQMPSFQGKLKDDQITALIEFIKAQK